jgi:hypothetical protein
VYGIADRAGAAFPAFRGPAMRPVALKTRISTPRLAETVRFYHAVLGMRVIET